MIQVKQYSESKLTSRHGIKILIGTLALFGFAYFYIQHSLHHGSDTKISSNLIVDHKNFRRSSDCHIFRPKLDNAAIYRTIPDLIASPETWIRSMTYMYQSLDAVTDIGLNQDSPLQRARYAYTQLLAGIVTGRSFGLAEMSVVPELEKARAVVRKYNETLRQSGEDHTYLGTTMVGTRRIRNLEALLLDVFKNNVSGGIMETGVWRGGSSIYARGIIRAYGEGSERMSYVCDSFMGFPPGNKAFHYQDTGWDNTAYMEASVATVIKNFKQMGVLDANIVFAQGFFNNTMPILAPSVDKLALLRMDADIYQSTVDVLYHMYGKLSLNGYVILDDWFGFPARVAVEDFFAVHNMSLPTIMPIDSLAVYWQKTQEIKNLQYWRYQQSKFKP